MNTPQKISSVTILAVVAILVVVAAVIIPAWRNHQVSLRIAEALDASDGAKLAVMEAATVRGGLARIRADELGYMPSGTRSPYIAHIEIADGGRITLKTRNTGALQDPTFLLIPAEGAGGQLTSLISWSCITIVGDPAIAPSNCRVSPTATPTPAKTTTTANASRVEPA